MLWVCFVGGWGIHPSLDARVKGQVDTSNPSSLDVRVKFECVLSFEDVLSKIPTKTLSTFASNSTKIRVAYRSGDGEI